MGVIEKTKELTEAIRETQEFKDLKHAKLEIEKNRALVKEVEEFNRKQSDLYNAKISIKEAELRSEELNKIYKGLAQIPEVARYMNAVKRFNDVTMKVFEVMNQSLESELKLK